MKMLPPSNQQSEGNPLKQSKKAYLWVMAISGVTNILMFALPIYMMQVYERVLPGQKIETLVLLTIIVLFILAIYTLFSHIRTRILMDISQWVDRQISRPLLEKSADAVLEGNEYPNQALADVYSINQFLGSSALASLFDLPWSPLYFAVLFGIHPLLGFFSVCLAVLIFHLAVLNEMLMRKNVISQVKSQKYVQSLMGSMVRSSEVLQAMGMSQNVKNRLLEEKEKTLNFQLSTSKVGERILSLIKYLRLIGQVLILGIGAYLVIQGNITGGAMIAGSIFMSRGLAPIEQAIGAWKLFIQFRDAYKRVESFLAKPSTRQERMELPAPKGDVFLENVHFTFTNAEQFVLKQVTMHVPPGSMVAVIGHSASGKTTLCRLILGILKPSLGRVCLDGAEVYHRNRMEIGPHIGYLPQDIELFPGTIKENIARLGEVDPEAVVKAARLAGAHEMILKLPQGYETRISESGSGLSLGQLQRIGIARALYGSPKLIVLDEPDSNLDREGEFALFETLQRLKLQKVTTFIISHRLSIIRFVDLILCLQQGRIKEFGPRDEVIEQIKKEAEAQKMAQPAKTVA